MAESTISEWRHDPVFMAAYGRRREEERALLREQMAGMGGSALATIYRLSRGGKGIPAAVALQASKDLLDRLGYSEPEKLEIRVGDLDRMSDADLGAELARLRKEQAGRVEAEA